MASEGGWVVGCPPLFGHEEPFTFVWLGPNWCFLGRVHFMALHHQSGSILTPSSGLKRRWRYLHAGGYSQKKGKLAGSSFSKFLFFYQHEKVLFCTRYFCTVIDRRYSAKSLLTCLSEADKRFLFVLEQWCGKRWHGFIGGTTRKENRDIDMLHFAF